VDSSPDPVVELYEFWKTSTGRNGGTVLTDGRRSAVKGRLAEGRTVEEIRTAIANVAASDWHMKRGRHVDRDGQVHDDLKLICSPGKFEGYRDMGGGSTATIATGPISGEDEARRAWDVARESVRGKMPDSTYRMWIEGFEAAGSRSGRLVLVDTAATGGGRVAWFRRRYTALLLRALEEAGAEYSGIEVVDETQLELEAR
jgi:hypothetical protein